MNDHESVMIAKFQEEKRQINQLFKRNEKL